MVCRFQCDHCQDVLSVADKLTGKRIRCPLCETVITVPAADPDRVFLDVDFAAQLERFKLTDWDRACARKALALGMVEPEPLRQAIVAIRRAAKAGQTPALNEQLLAAGAIETSHNLALCELIKGTLQKQEAQKLSECPNCFAAIPAKSAACKFCGQKLGDLLLYDMCPNCKKEQPTGRELCRACGATMATGLMPGVALPRCPRCSKVIKGDYDVCPKCRTPLGTSKARIELEAKLRQVRHWWSRYSLAVVGAGVLLVGLFAYRHWVDIKGWLVGPERAQLEARVEAFKKALEFADFVSLTRMFDPDLKQEADQKARTVILGGRDPTWVVQRVDQVRVPTINIEKDKTQATAYAQIEGQFDPATVTFQEVKDVTDISKAANKLRSGHLLRSQVPWQWVRRNDEWYYAGPLPK